MKARILVCPKVDEHEGQKTTALCFDFPNCAFKHICYVCDSLLIPTTEFEEFYEYNGELGKTMIAANPHVQITGIE